MSDGKVRNPKLFPRIKSIRGIKVAQKLAYVPSNVVTREEELEEGTIVTVIEKPKNSKGMVTVKAKDKTFDIFIHDLTTSIKR